MNFPRLSEFEEFMSSVYTGEGKLFRARWIYEGILNSFKTPEAFLRNEDIMPETGIAIIFLSFKLRIKPSCNIQSITIRNCKEIIDFFNLVPDKFWKAFESEVIGSERRKRTFLVQIIKALIYLQKKNVSEINYEDMLMLRNDDFFTGKAKTESFPTILEKTLGMMNGKALPQRLPKTTQNNKDYGTSHIDIRNIIILYLEYKYLNKGQNEESPLSAIRTFFKWLHGNFDAIDTVGDITKEQWLSYKAYIISSTDIKERTKQMKLDMVSMFFEWLQIENYIKDKIVDVGERYKVHIKHKPRMFQEREHYKKILEQIILFEPENEREELVKQYLLVASSTGLRAKEVLWIGPDCLNDVKNEAGEIILQVREKLKVKNKVTSILLWGIDSVMFLQDRFNKNDKKLKFYNKKTNAYFYSLFQDGNKLLDSSFIYKVFNRIMEMANITNERGEAISFKDVKMHGFRHQKFNDIYQVTNGSLSAVKIDSGHKTIAMARVYTQQQEKNRQIETIKLIESGEIVGKGAEIIKQMMKTPYSLQRYIKIVEKMNLAVNSNSIVKKSVMKYLGFGFCSAKSCKIKGVCERCDFFYTCKTFINELSDRYSKNFVIVKSRLGNNVEESLINDNIRNLIIDLKYQEKWLMELGITDEEINKLRIKLL